MLGSGNGLLSHHAKDSVRIGHENPFSRGLRQIPLDQLTARTLRKIHRLTTLMPMASQPRREK